MNRVIARQDQLRRDIETLNFSVRGEERKLERVRYSERALDMVKDRRQEAKARAESI